MRGTTMRNAMVDAEPEPIAIDPAATALVIIDMQRDFLEPGGFGEMLGNDVSQLRRTIEPNRSAARRRRAASGCWSSTRAKAIAPISTRLRRPPRRSAARRQTRIGDAGPMGRILVRGEAGPRHHPRAVSARRRAGDRQAGQGRVLRHRPARDPAEPRHRHSCIVTGVTTEVCVNTTVREANDRGYDCLVPGDCVRLLLPRVSGDGPADDQGAGRHLRLGLATRTGSSPRWRMTPLDHRASSATITPWRGLT